MIHAYKLPESAEDSNSRGCQGKSNRQRLSSRLLRRITPISMICSGIMGIIMICMYYASTWSVHNLYPIQHFEVVGQGKMVPDKLIKASLADLLGQNFFSISLPSLGEKLTILPGVAQVRISRKVPGTVVVNIEEHTAIARWNERKFLNADLKILPQPEHIDLKHLPLLQGHSGSQKFLMNRLKKLKPILHRYNFAISSLKMDQLGTMEMRIHPDHLLLHSATTDLNPTHEISVILGRQDVELGLQKLFTNGINGLSENLRKIKRIDLRYKTGYSVGLL